MCGVTMPRAYELRLCRLRGHRATVVEVLMTATVVPTETDRESYFYRSVAHMTIHTSIRLLAAMFALVLVAGACSGDDLAYESGGGDAIVECFPDSVLVATTEAMIESVTVESASGTTSDTGVDDFVHEVAATDIAMVTVVDANGARTTYDCSVEAEADAGLGEAPAELAFAADGVRVSCTDSGATVTSGGPAIEQIITISNGVEQTIDNVNATEFTIDDPTVSRVMVVAGDDESFGGYAARHDCIRSVGVYGSD